MADVSIKNIKLVQYLGEAYGKEKELETALQAHIGMTERAAYKKRLQQHLRETKDHARKVERRINALGGGGQRIAELTGRAIATAKGPLHAFRGSGSVERELKNAKTEYSEEAEEIANYTAIEVLAEEVGDRETAKMAREIRRQEERMASYLERLIPSLTKAVVRSEIPAAERDGGRRRTTRRRSGSTARRSTRARGTATGRGSSARTRSGTRRTGRSRSRSRS